MSAATATAGSEIARAPLPKQRPWLAALLSLVVPGLGHVYARNFRRGLNWLLGWMLLIIFLAFGGPITMLAIFLSLALPLFVAADAYRSARKPRPAEELAAGKRSRLLQLALILAVGIGFSRFVRSDLIQAYKIPSGAMEPTLLIGDHIIVNKLDYGFRLPDSIFGLTPFASQLPYGKYLFPIESVHRGDVVVFVFPEDRSKDFVKRVVAIQ